MKLGPVLRRAFFERRCPVVARDLVGCFLVRTLPDGTRLVGRLIEVEAYLGDGSDPASHCHRGPTPRNGSMFGPPGRLYAYRSYGIHTCVNVVCEPEGRGAGVLLRALEPVAGVETMCALRGLASDRRGREVASGPGRLAQALDLRLEHDGLSLLRGPLRLRGRSSAGRRRVARGPRVGISKGVELPYRFYEADHPWVSAGPRKGGPLS
ncbi:MAG: DNA-3-methyladenine glycosylase [Proteobacteria bacterium]|nr:DNA-3-methyladenine glycosylase [Pseudomonadota bacterium]